MANVADRDADPDRKALHTNPRRAPVSVVIPCYRCMATIDDAVASIVAQTLRPAEVILVDDRSNDGTLAHLMAVAGMHQAGWIRVVPLADNGGPSRARNIGWQQATQPYVAFLDADDRWAPRKLELQMAALVADPSLALVGHRMHKRRRGTPFPPVRATAPARVLGRARLLFHNPFPTTSVVLRRDLPVRFDPAVWYSEEYLLWSQLVLLGYRCARIDQVLAFWNAREQGATGLSDNISAVHRSRCLMRRKLLSDGLIDRPEYLFARTAGVVSKVRREIRHRFHRH